MSNEPNTPTQFQQKAELRLQEMELEWRRSLFERFRTICREEMEDVMQALMRGTSTAASAEMETRMEEIKRDTATQHAELMASMLEIKGDAQERNASLALAGAQTAEELRGIRQIMEQPRPPDPQMAEMISREQQAFAREIASKQEESARTIQEDVRQTADAARASTRKAVLTTALACLLAGALAAAGLYLLTGMTLVNSSDLKSREQMLAQKGAAESELAVLREQKAALQKEIETLAAQKQAADTGSRQATAAQAALVASLNTLQQNITRLQALEDQFRFKLVKGETGGVFVEIPEDAKSFKYAEKTFIEVK